MSLKKKNLYLFFIIFFFILVNNVKSTYIISSVSFKITPTAQTAKIGDYILFNLVALDVTATASDASVATVNSSAIYIYSTDYPATPTFGDPLYVYDGAHTWRVTTFSTNPVNPSQQVLMLDNSNMIGGFSVEDYNSLEYASFTIVGGSQVSGGTASIDIGTSVYGIVLYDDGDISNHNDSTANDGVYNTKFLVREVYQFNVVNGSIVGHFSKNSINASNDPFIASEKISIDGIRPKIDLVNVSPNPYNPNKTTAKFFYYLSENCDVDFKIFYNNVTIKTIDTEGLGGYNQPVLWDGLSNTGVMQTDGDYYYRFDIVDSAGNTGESFVGLLKITTVEILTTIYSIDANYNNTGEPETIVTLKINVELRNATTFNLQNLGFNYSETPGTHDFRNYPYAYVDVQLYDISGNKIHTFEKDAYSLTDTDPNYIDPSTPQFIDGLPMVYPGYTYNPLPADRCSTTNTAIYVTGDEDTTNDWDTVFGTPLEDQGGGVFKCEKTFVYFSSSMSPGTYFAAAKSILVGKHIVLVSDKVEEGTANCSGSDYTYYYLRYHAQPSHFYDGSTAVLGDERGYGLSSEEKTASFVVESEYNPPSGDNTPPRIVANSEYPSNGAVLEPGIVGPDNYLKVMLADDGVGAGSTNLSSFVLKDPYGNVVPGYTAWNAGTPDTKTWEIYYIPDNDLTLGGTYSYTIIPVDAANNIGAATTYTFTISDTSIPQVTNVSVFSSTGSSQQLSSSTTTQIQFLVSHIEATLIPGGTIADVDWNSSNIQVKDSNGDYISGSVSHDTDTNILVFTPDSLLSDGNYTVYITAVSDQGNSGVYTYNFYITTAGLTYINLNGTGETDTTYMIISIVTESNSGIVDANSNTISPDSIFVNEVSNPQNSPEGYSILGRVVSFSVTSTAQLPLTFNSNFCSVTLRMHLTDSDLQTLTNLGLTTDDLYIYVFDGANWNKLSSNLSFTTSGTDHYVDITISDLPSGNQYAIMYSTPATQQAEYHFNNTKIFNPKKSEAKIYYTDNINNIENVKVYVYSLRGTLVRKMEYLNPQDTSKFINYDTDPYTGEIRYYFLWDGKNDKGTYLVNGMYILKIEVINKDGSKDIISRLIAIVK